MLLSEAELAADSQRGKYKCKWRRGLGRFVVAKKATVASTGVPPLLQAVLSSLHCVVVSKSWFLVHPGKMLVG
jgi:hypothetical protein